MDLRELRLPEPVDTLTCTFDTINYLRGASDLRTAFAAFATALKPKGAVVFDFIPEGAAKGPLRRRQRVELGRYASEWRMAIDPAGHGSHARIDITAVANDGHPSYYRETHIQTWHAESEVMTALRDCTFSVLELRPAEPGEKGRWMHCTACLDRQSAV
jgi:hypothetical protein